MRSLAALSGRDYFELNPGAARKAACHGYLLPRLRADCAGP